MTTGDMHALLQSILDRGKISLQMHLTCSGIIFGVGVHNSDAEALDDVGDSFNVDLAGSIVGPDKLESVLINVWLGDGRGFGDDFETKKSDNTTIGYGHYSERIHSFTIYLLVNSRIVRNILDTAIIYREKLDCNIVQFPKLNMTAVISNIRPSYSSEGK